MNVSAGLGLLISAIALVVGIILIASGGGLAWVGAALVSVGVVFGGVLVTS